MPPYQYFWRLPNGEYYYSPAPEGRCPAVAAVSLMNNINVQSLNQFAYAIDGVAIDSSAIGTPQSLFSSLVSQTAPLANATAIYGESLLSVTQCAPVMEKNPISCRPGGNVTLIRDKNLSEILVSNGSCKAQQPFDSSDSTVMAASMCPTFPIGAGRIVIGATNV